MPRTKTAVVEGVTFPRAMFDALRHFPDVLNRSRHVAPQLVPMHAIGQIQRAAELIHAHREWADQHPEEDVPISDELWELVKDWPTLLERCRVTPGIRFAPIEVQGIVLTRTLWPEGEE